MKKRDKLEKFILNNRDDIDKLNPPVDAWKKIESESGIKKLVSYNFLWKAAAVIFFALSSYLLVEKIDTHAQENSNFAPVEDFYMSEINKKIELISFISDNDLSMSPSTEQDLQKLNAMYLVLKEEMKRNSSKQVVDALTLNLLIRIDILNEELRKLENMDAAEEKDDKNTST